MCVLIAVANYKIIILVPSLVLEGVWFRGEKGAGGEREVWLISLINIQTL